MATVRGYINIYRSGFFHSPGKPGAYDRHPGDCYATREDAVRDIHPRSHYVATCPVEWEEETVPSVNAPAPVAAEVKDGIVTMKRPTGPVFAVVGGAVLFGGVE